MIVFDVPLWQLFTLLSGVVLPLLVGLVTTKVTSPSRKAVILAALAVATSLLAELAAALQRGEEYNLGMALLLGIGTFLVATGTHYGFWKPTGVAEKAQGTLHAAEPETTRVSAGPELVINTHGRTEELLTEQQYLGNTDPPKHRAGD